MNRRPRLKLRNLDVSQKLLVLVILATVGGGYLAALANLFAQHSEADGRATVKLEDLPRVVRTEGVGKAIAKLQDSLGMQDVIRRYHGTGSLTRMEAELEGGMKMMIEEKLVDDEGDKTENRKEAEALRRMLIDWVRLSPDQRKSTYETGVPVDDDGHAILPSAVKKTPKEADLVPKIKETFDTYCARCHKVGGVDETAANFPLDSFPAIEKYSVVDNGVSIKSLALTTHVHLLGFSVLFAMTGFLFSMTDFPALLRILVAPTTLALQIAEIACWWMAKADVFYAKMIFYLGPAVGAFLLIQIGGALLDLLFRRPEAIE
ncbi:MAG TPA: hypothetical protein VNC50_01040, partial [Planctomycetia bacterium]|nr:hypothetical protein [Planctomycetia bacterium]